MEAEKTLSDLSKIVADSEKVNFTKVDSGARIARPPGRPRKDGRPAGSVKTIEVPLEETVTATAQPAPESGQNATPEASCISVSDIPDAAFGFCADFPFLILASKTEFDGFYLTQPERDVLTPAIKAVAEIYMPKMNPKHAPALVLAMSASTLLLQKSLAYAAWKRSKVVPAHAEVRTGGPSPNPAATAAPSDRAPIDPGNGPQWFRQTAPRPPSGAFSFGH